MKRPQPTGRQYRLWIGRIGTWRPRSWNDVPPRFVALAPADEGSYSAKHALAFLEGFNRQMLATRGRHWAVALADGIRSSGDCAPPRFFSAHQLRRDGPTRGLRRRGHAGRRASEDGNESPGDAVAPRRTLHFVRAMKTAK
jgi:hypothetical protein